MTTVQAQSRITFHKVENGKSSYTHFRYSDDGKTFTAADATRLAELSALRSICPQDENGWETGRWSYAQKQANTSSIRTKELLPIAAGVYVLATNNRKLVEVTFADENQKYIRHQNLTHGKMFTVNPKEKFIAVAVIGGKMEDFRSMDAPAIPGVYPVIPQDGRNLLLGSDQPKAGSSAYIGDYSFAVPPIAGERVRCTVWGDIGAGKTEMWAYNSVGNGNMAFKLDEVNQGVYSGVMEKWKVQAETDIAGNNVLQIYAFPEKPNGKTVVTRIDRIKFEYDTGAVTDYAPAPEEMLFGTTPGEWLGVQVSESPVPSKDFGDYKWSKVKGEKGEKGEPGAQGESRMLYSAGFYDAGTTYVKENGNTPYVIYPSDDTGVPYILIADSSKGNPPTDARYWKPMNALRETFIKALVAEFGQIGSAIFSGDLLISQTGLDSQGNESTDFKNYPNGFTPYLSLNFKTGEVFAGKGNFSGVLRRSKTVITQANKANFIRSFQQGSYKRETLDFRRLGAWTKITDNTSMGLLYLPNSAGTANGYNEKYNDYLRALVGQKILIYVESGSITIHDYSHTSGSWGETVTSGQFIALECVQEINSVGMEYFRWKRTKGKFYDFAGDNSEI